MWEFRGHDGGRKIDGKRCANPSDQLKLERSAMQKIGCKVSAITRTGSAYNYTTECDLKTRGGREMKSLRRTALKLRGNQAFELTVRGTTNGHAVDDRIVGKRVGDCKNEK